MKKEAQAGKGTWGGRRPGAGRPKGSGKGPSPDARRNRVAVMFSDHELELLRRLARKAGIPLSTLAHRSCIKGLERLR